MFKCGIVQALRSLIKDHCEHTCLRAYNECSRLEKTDYGARIDFHQYSGVTTLIVMWLKTRVSRGCYTKATESIGRVGSLPLQQVSSHFPCCYLCFPCHQCSNLNWLRVKTSGEVSESEWQVTGHCASSNAALHCQSSLETPLDVG